MASNGTGVEGADEAERSQFDPWAVDAASWKNLDFERLPASGGAEISSFCMISGTSGRDAGRSRPDKTVLVGQRGLGKSFLLRVRSHNHRQLPGLERTFFYPEGRKTRDLVESLSSLSGAIPEKHPLRSASSGDDWSAMWQVAIIGLLVWRLADDLGQVNRFHDWFAGLTKLGEQYASDTDESGKPVRQLPIAPLQWFLGQMIEAHTSGKLGSRHSQNQLLFLASTEWAVQIKKALVERNTRLIAVYIDNPDELVSPDEPDLWTNIQQGLLLAIWKLRKGGALTDELQVFASIRAEALAHRPHRDLSTAMDLTITLRYDRDSLRDLFEHRIALTPKDQLVAPSILQESPVVAFLGCRTYDHQDRHDALGNVLREDIVSAIIRHTRMVPRDMVLIGREICKTTASARDVSGVRAAVNLVGRNIVEYLRANCFPAWSPSLDSLLRSISSPVVPGDELRRIAKQFDLPHGNFGNLRTLLALGLIGSSTRDLRQHRHAYIQRFTFDLSPDGTNVNSDFFFVHSSTKEWIRLRPDYSLAWTDKEGLLIGDGLPFESQSPRIRLAIRDDQPTIIIKKKPLQPGPTGSSDPVKFLFLALLAWKQVGSKLTPTIHHLISIRRSLEADYPGIDLVMSCEVGHKTPAIRDVSRDAFTTARLRDWAKKLNKLGALKEIKPRGKNRAQFRVSDARLTGIVSINGGSPGTAPTLAFNGLDPLDIAVDISIGA